MKFKRKLACSFFNLHIKEVYLIKVRKFKQVKITLLKIFVFNSYSFKCVKLTFLFIYLFFLRKHSSKGYVTRYFPDSQILCRKAKMQPLKHFLTQNTVEK